MNENVKIIIDVDFAMAEVGGTDDELEQHKLRTLEYQLESNLGRAIGDGLFNNDHYHPESHDVEVVLSEEAPARRMFTENRFQDWTEVHFRITEHMILFDSPVEAAYVKERGNSDSRMTLAKELADKFQSIHGDVDWGESELPWDEVIETFMFNELKTRK